MAPHDADSLRRRLLPLELAEAELSAKPAAAVLALLRDGPGGLEVLVGERARREGDPWAGHVGLPGGMRRPEDASVLATALRETEEEMGLVLAGRAEVLGHMPPRAPGNRPDVLVVPYVALAHDDVEPLPREEMTATFWCVLRDLPTTRGSAVVSTILGDLTVPAFLYQGRVIWGFTYRLLEELLVLVGPAG